MKLRGILSAAFCLCLVTAIASTMPVAAQTLSAQPGAFDFVFNPANPTPVDPESATIQPSVGTLPTLSVSLTLGNGTPNGLFHISSSGASVNVGVDSIVLGTLVAKGNALYTATVVVNAAGFTPLNLPVTLSIGKDLSLAASPTSLTFPFTGTTSQTVNLTATDGVVGFALAVSTTNGGAWLSVTANSNYTPATLTVTADPAGLPSGTYSGTITVTPPIGAPTSIQVTLSGGASKSLTATPTAFTFAFTTGQSAPAAQVLSLTSTLASNNYNALATSGGNWLMLNGVSQVAGTLPANVNVTVKTTGLASGTYQGNISVSSADGGLLNLPVTLTINGVSAVANPSSLSFLAQANGPTPSQQIVLVNGSGGTYTATPSAQGNWLAVSPSSGSTPAQLNVSVIPGTLVAGTYTGNIAIATTLGTQNVAVTMVVSANPVLSSNPGVLNFTYKAGDPAPAAQALTVSVTGGTPQAFSVGTSLPSWVHVAASSGSTPSNLSVTVSPAGLASGTYVANVPLTPALSGSQTLSIPVILTVTGSVSVVPSVSSLTFTGAAGSGAQSQNVSVVANAPTTFTASASTSNGGGWLSVSPLTGTASAAGTPIAVTVNAASLSQGTYQGTITLTSATQVVSLVAVTFNVGQTPLTVTPTSLTFSYTQGGTAPATQTVQVGGTEAFTATAVTSDSAGWLTATPASGTGPATLTVTANPAGLAPGTHTGTINVTPAGGAAQSISVTFTVIASNALTVNPSSLAFFYRAGDVAPAAQTLTIATTSNAAIPFTAAAGGTSWLAVTPASGTAPGTLSVSVTPGNLDAGMYSGTVTVTGGGSSIAVPVTITVTAPLPAISSLVNAASYLGGGVSPGEIAVVFGSNLGPSTGIGATVDSTGKVGTSLGNVQVTFNGYPAPILYASTGQVNLIVPYEVYGASNALIVLSFAKSKSNSLTLPVVSSAPGIFSADASGKGAGAILDSNYHLVNSGNPAKRGSFIQIYATGEGQTVPAGIDGKVAGTVLPLPVPKLAAVGVTIGGLPAQVLYVGSAPGLVAGALQLNVSVPDGLGSGIQPVFVSIGGNSSQAGLTVAVE
ncbi:MAG: BACON domain-containing carbohydrate-binding protein [Bryobacteraceae bacterium]